MTAIPDPEFMLTSSRRAADREREPSAEDAVTRAKGSGKKLVCLCSRMPEYIRYADDLETIEADEPETIRKIIDVMSTGLHNVKVKEGRAVRISHAKAYAFVKGEFIVADGLPAELAQGLFATPATYPVLMRMATAPGELLDDAKVPTARGVGIKVMNVPGPKLPGHDADTQDFVLENGRVFIAGGLKEFLLAFTPNATIAPKLPEAVKGVVSHAAHAANVVLSAVGLPQPKLDFYGHPTYHPMAEAHYSQVPLRYGDYVAKLRIVPANEPLKAMLDKAVGIPGEHGLRTLAVDYFKAHSAEFEVQVQLCTDTKTMPIENAKVEWPENQSPYRTVARIVLPPQNTYSDARQEFVDHRVDFSPGHALLAHRPMGSIMRARLAVYPALQKLRHAEQHSVPVEPANYSDVPDA